MLQIDMVQQIDGVIVYGDHERFNVFYLVPQQARYRRFDNGKLAFNFVKYRFPVDREDGKKGGGYLLFDAEFVVDEAKIPHIREVLTAQVVQEANRRGIAPAPEVVFGTITYSKGTTSLIVVGSNDTFVEQVHNPGKPSLFGNNVATFGLELTQEGATLFEQIMQGASGSVSVIYDLWFWARLPQIKVDGYFHASTFYSFYQTIDTEWSFWSEDEYRESVRELMIQSESFDLNFDWGGLVDEKIQREIRDWASRTLEEAVERKMIEAVAPVPDDQRKLPDGIEDVTRDISNTQISDVDVHYRESQTVEWNLAPQGMLQNITSLKEADGTPVKWENYARVVDLNDPFFRQLRVDTYVNADFKNLPIHSVEVKLLYDDNPMPNLEPGKPEGEVVLRSTDEIGKFAQFVENDNWNFKYSYQVNYRGESRIYQSPEIETNEGNLTIGVDDVGILSVDVATGDLNWAEVDRALVTFRYEDRGVDPVEEQFQLSQTTPSHKVQRVIFEPMRQNYKYKVKFFMKNGKEIEGDEKEARSDKLFIDDVFGGRKKVMLLGIGDFATRVQMIFVNLKYTDTKNDYVLTHSQVLSSALPNFEWAFPVISEAEGQVTYSATIAYKDGTSQTIPETVAGDQITLPPAIENFMEVKLITDLIDWTQMRLVRVSLNYLGPSSNGNGMQDFIFSPARAAGDCWKVPLLDASQTNYRYTITFFRTDGLQKVVGPVDGSGGSLILDPLAA